jgi:hypothetical protein
LQNRGRGVVEDLILKLVDAVVEVVDGREVPIDDGIEDEKQQLGGMFVIAVAEDTVGRGTLKESIFRD